jgi:hypothetical protein
MASDAICAWLSGENISFHEVSNALFEKKWVALSPLYECALQIPERDVGAEQSVEEASGNVSRERIEPDLSIE